MRGRARASTQASASRACLGLNGCAHRAPRPGDELVGTKGMNLVSLEFSVLLSRGQHHNPALEINLLRQQVARFGRMTKELPEHADHILIRVIVVVPENDMVTRLSLWTADCSGTRQDSRVSSGWLGDNRLCDSRTGGIGHHSGTLEFWDGNAPEPLPQYKLGQP